MCFDAFNRASDGECPVVWMDHELLIPLGAASKEHFEVEMTDEQWKAKLSPRAYAVLRHEGTETPYSSPLNDEHRKGTFTCAGSCRRAETGKSSRPS